MKMHLLSGGRLRMKRGIFVPGAAREELIDLPVMAALFRHAKANVLFDTGCHPLVETDPEARWGGMAKALVPIAPPKSDVISSLTAVGLGPTDIDIVINSHLHTDHCGCNEFFTRATFVCHAEELALVRSKEAEALGYLAADWDHPMPFETVTGEHDVLGDGRLVTVPLPGHTPGLIGLHAGLDRSGEFLLASDALTLMRNLANDEVPRNAMDADALLASYETIRRLEGGGARVICGHDDAQWQSLKRGGDAYE